VQIRGGSLLAYFGYPQASENAARLGVQAALAVSRTRFAGLAVRTAVHTGMVICGDLQIPDTIGATSGLAIRLRQLAEDGEVTISGATQALVAGYFNCSSLGQQQLPGTKRPLEPFRVDGESGATSRLEASGTLTPLVGRKHEIATLLTMWQSARNGTRRIALLRGEAGIGKSRLVHTLKLALRGETCVVRELHCLPEHSRSPFYPLTALFGTTLGFSTEDSPEARFDKLAAYVELHYANAEPDTVPLLAGMLSLPLRAPYRASASSPQQQREKLLKIVLGRLFDLASRQPVLLIVEDLHWADPSTIELLEMFVTRELATPMLAVLTARPGFVPPWREAMADAITLGALDDVDTNELIATVAPGIAPATARRIIARADGIPLFAEELARQSAVNDLAAIPGTLQDLLATRLDGMGQARIAAQAAASIGREFTLELMHRVTPFDEATLGRYLAQLQSAGLVQEEAGNRFQFRHALLCDAAYHSQTRTEREARHRHIAEALRASGGDIRPELLAQHWAAGGEIHEAVACWSKAGKLAARHSASVEAIMHFRSGLALVETLPDTTERVRLELDLQIGLGAAACAAQGYASAEGADAYARAMALCTRHESGPDMFRALWGLWGSASSRSGYADALILARRLLDISQRSGDPMQGQQAHFAMGNTLYWQGQFSEARKHLERVSETYLPVYHQGHVAEFGEDAGITSASYASWVLWFLGYPDQALESSARAVALARQLGHPYSLAYALTFATILHCRMRQPEQALALGDETLNLATEHGFPLWQIGATLSCGWALVMQNHAEGIESLRLCVEATRAAMGGVTLIVLEPLADANAFLGFADQALSICDEALALGRAIGDHQTEAELHRLRGEALLGTRKPKMADAVACFEQALAISRKQKAKSLELRAAMSLAGLRQQEWKQEEARRLLAEVYGRFTEGFATPDLCSAKALLQELGEQGNA
jgi:tetratricopeptide (TPR) repeat protein